MAQEESVVLHGSVLRLSDIEDDIEECLQEKWRREKWKKRAALVSRDGGAQSLYIGQRFDVTRFELQEEGWTHDHCEICGFTLAEGDDPESSEGYTDGFRWICVECFDKLLVPRGVQNST
jgi:hypothetical protein